MKAHFLTLKKLLKVSLILLLVCSGLITTIDAQNPEFSNYWTNLTGHLNQNQEIDMTPEIIIEGNTIHLVWFEYKSQLTANLWYRRSTDLGTNWEAPKKLYEFTEKNNLYGNNTFSKVMSVNGNTINIAFSDYFYYKNGVGKLFFIQSNDGGNSFTTPAVLDQTVEGGYRMMRRAQICSFGNKIAIAYEKSIMNMNVNDIRLKFSTDNGATFKDTLLIPGTESNDLRALHFEGGNIIVLTESVSSFVTSVSQDLKTIKTTRIGEKYEHYTEVIYTAAQDGDDYEYRSPIAQIGNTIHIVLNERTNIAGEGVRYYVNYIRSFDNGQTFEERRRITEAYSPSPVVLAKNNLVYIGFRDNGKFRLISSTDGGDSFGAINTDLDGVMGGHSYASTKYSMFLDPLDATGSSLYVVGNLHSLAKFTENGTKLSEFTGFPVSALSRDLMTNVAIDKQGVKHWFMQYKPKGGTDLDIYYHHQGREPEPGETNKVFDASKLPGSNYPGMLIVPHSESLEFDDKITVELLVKLNPENYSTSDGPLIFSSSKASFYYHNSVTGYQIGYRVNKNGEFLINTGINTEYGGFTFASPYQIKDTLWHHVAITYDKDAGKDNFISYIDGVVANKQTVTGKIEAGKGMVHLGLTSSFQSESYNTFCNIDNVRIWDKALSNKELRENLTRTDFTNEGNLKLFLNFDDTFKDISGNGNDALPITIIPDAKSNFDPPKAAFDLYKQLDEVSIINKSFNATSYHWDFGNKQTSTLDNPKYQYPAAGEYDITLVAKNDNAVAAEMQQVSIEGLERVYPAKIGNTGQVYLDIYGGGLSADGTEVILRREGQSDQTANQVILSDRGNLTAIFSLNGIEVGKWDVVVKKGKTESILAQALDVETVKEAENWVQVSGLGFFKENRWQNFKVFYGNKGNVDSYSVPLWIAISDELGLETTFLDFETEVPEYYKDHPDKIKIEELGYYFTAEEVNGKPMKARVISILIPVIRANSTNSFTIRFKVTAETAKLGDVVDIVAYLDRPWLTYEDLLPQTKSSLFSTQATADMGSVGFSAECVVGVLGRGVIDATTNTVPFVGGIWEGMKAVHGAYKLATGGEKERTWNAYWNVGLAAISSGTSFVKDLAFPIKWGMAAINLASSMYDLKNCAEPRSIHGGRILHVDAIDPNEMIGPSGFGDAGWIKALEKIPYTILFENISTASAPAHDVFITDTLDRNVFDYSKFSWGDFGWGDKIFHQKQENAKEFSQDIDLRPNKNLKVRVAGKFDEETGVARVEFISLNPETLSEEEDPLNGFLPPNGNNGEGEGFINFTIGIKENLTTGSILKNKASIVFDTNQPILTNEYINTLDFEPPVSSVKSATEQSDDSLLVTWSGTDTGSGISEYSVFVQNGEGIITPLVLGTQETSLSFKPETNGTYKFYSIATDNTYQEEIDGKEFEVTYMYVGIENFKTNNELLEISPIPASSFIRLRLLSNEWNNINYTLELIGIDGIVRRKENIQGEILHTGLNMDIHDLSSGIYLIRLYNGEKLYSKKFIKDNKK